ncbi:GTPase HflX [Patescibacteria group bacterium]|nr:GTPase HflX [Patescibacteria group bacterium]MBU1016404.1 GTPase HflX [Patescibacteria group bacterium]MBU1685152.1 GTPase HflX [Patescibacteria group bacterium]MBU1938809.1 GTPase HflX [Patescibacteria group bacterium]
MLPRAILVDIIGPDVTPEESLARLNELESLLVTYGGFVIVRKIQKKQVPDYKTYIGKGKVEEILQDSLDLGAEFVIINNLLKPQQLYNLEGVFRKHEIRVWDKIDLILKIFSKHATTKEAKLQIELASLKHLGPRIFRMGQDLMRQGGGIGTRGQGETNIEIMKRHIAAREHKIKEDLKKIVKNQEGQRNKRQDQGFKTAAIVGYTNAGKSRLLQSLTNKKVKVKDELFATLDSRIGKVYLPDINQSVLISDTIGFIRDLPPELIEAFDSTLAETVHSDMLLHVIDCSDFEIEWKIRVVDEVLKKLRCSDKSIIHVFNKIDLLGETRKKNILKEFSHLKPIFISAEKKINLDALKNSIADKLG